VGGWLGLLWAGQQVGRPPQIRPGASVVAAAALYIISKL